MSDSSSRAVIGGTLVAGLLGCGLLACAGAPAPVRIPHVALQITVYTPVMLRRNVTLAPAAWLGHVVWVRARAVRSFVWTCRHDYLCVIRQPSLADPMVDAADARLVLAVPTDAPLVAMARRLPLVGPLVMHVVAPAEAIAWGRVALYHLQLTRPAACADPSCVLARLVATP